MTSVGRVTEYSPDRLGTYVRLPDQYKEGYLAPVYAKATLKHDVSHRFYTSENCLVAQQLYT